MLDAILISDLHLGTEGCQVRAILDFLDALPPTARLVLNGDMLQDTESRLTKQHWRVLSRLRKLSDQLELVWVRGNHDYDAESVAHLVGANFVEQYEFESGGRHLLCVHGDAWDRFITDHPIITLIADWFYLWMQRMSRRLATRAKRSSKTFLRCVERVKSQAVEYGKARGADVVICGHTHHAEECRSLTPDAPWYYNSGSWADHHCQYLAVKDGVVRLGEVDVDAVVEEEIASFMRDQEPIGSLNGG
jgi:UDP-2,3-diacylglucosamine pyrophosphatase LpxH